MDLAELVLAYTRVLVWPVVVVALALTFRQKLRDLMERLTELGGGGLTMKFARQAEEIRRASQPRMSKKPAPRPSQNRKNAGEKPIAFPISEFSQVYDATRTLRDGSAIDIDFHGLSEREAVEALRYLGGFALGLDATLTFDKTDLKRMLIVPPAQD